MRFEFDYDPGAVTSIVGSMNSGKTEMLLNYVRHARRYANLRTQLFKWVKDNRGEGKDVVRGKDGSKRKATPIRKPDEVFSKLKEGVSVVGIDEAQFFNKRIVKVVQELSRRGYRIAVSGLNTNFRGEPFGSMPFLMAIAHDHIHCTARCTFDDAWGKRCGRTATQTQRVDKKRRPVNWHAPTIKVGNKEYEARCRDHHQLPGKPRFRVR